MKNQNQYDISIKFISNKSNAHIFSGAIPYLGSSTKTDQIEIYQNEIKLSAKRANVINLDEVFYNHNSSLYNQVIKSLVFFYSLNFNCPPIKEINITRKGQLGVLDKKNLKQKDISQPVANKIISNVVFDASKIEVIFEESEKGKSLLIALSYWLRAMSTNDSVYTFERLWRGLNRIYSFIGQTGTENINHRALRDFTIANPNILHYSLTEVLKYTDITLRNSFRWRGLILNDYPTQAKTTAFKDFIFRYSDERVMKLLNETLPYRQDFLVAANHMTAVNTYINNLLANPVKSDAELISLLCIKYMYFVRNKSFHGEKIDGTFRLIENKETIELEKLNLLQSCYVADLINANELY